MLDLMDVYGAISFQNEVITFRGSTERPFNSRTHQGERELDSADNMRQIGVTLTLSKNS